MCFFAIIIYDLRGKRKQNDGAQTIIYTYTTICEHFKSI